MRVIFKMYQTTSVASLLNITTDSEWNIFIHINTPTIKILYTFNTQQVYKLIMLNRT